MKTLTFIFTLLLTTITFSQPLAGYKFCIDPGHGGHDPANDRHIVEADFWESEGNFGKALHVEQILESFGAEVILTRYGNDDSDDIALSARSAIANQNNVDMFHSIHSNATGTSSRRNFVLMLYRGYDNDPVFPEAKDYSRTVYRNLEIVNYVEDLSWDNIRGDWDFYSWGTAGLGVLRNLTMPGVLSEGSFHDYLPEAWRLKNDYYLRHDAWGIVRALMDYYNAGEPETGIVAGIVRDPLENVPSSYKPISGLNDSKKPINNISVNLEPGGLVYEGDDQNNGYYFFDNLTPGEYTLIINAENYISDTTVVTVEKNKSRFVHRNLSIVPDYSVPQVLAYYPDDNSEQVSNLTDVIIEFDIRMNTASTQNAFTITPSAAGSFSWEDNYKKMVFKPSSPLQAGINYTITLSTDAKTHFDVNLSEQISFNFTTRSELNLVDHYPASGAAGIAPSVLIKLDFDAPIKQSTLGGNIYFYDEQDNFVSVSIDASAYARGSIEFTAAQPLPLNSTFRVILKEGLGDIEGIYLNEEIVIEFTTENTTYTDGTILDDFENAGSWQDPLLSPNTTDVDSALTLFGLTDARYRSEANSGLLDYSFTGTSGLVEIVSLQQIDLGSDDNTEFGTWVFGDYSSNILEYWIEDSQSNILEVEIDTVDWTGWHIKSVKLGELGGSAPYRLNSIVVRQSESGSSEGSVYFDDIQVDFITPVDAAENSMPDEFSLMQNYPNPFNPTTTINYSLPAGEAGIPANNVQGNTQSASLSRRSNTKPDQSINQSGNVLVSLVVYDMLGREVATIVNERQSPGFYNVEFDASSLSSGVYFYKLTAGSFISAKKMILLK